MPRFLIERRIPNAGALSDDDARAIARTSCEVLEQLGPSIQWVHSYVTADAITCVYIAPDEAILREHALRGGFPIDEVRAIKRIIDPMTAEAPDPAAAMT